MLRQEKGHLLLMMPSVQPIPTANTYMVTAARLRMVSISIAVPTLTGQRAVKVAKVRNVQDVNVQDVCCICITGSFILTGNVCFYSLRQGRECRIRVEKVSSAGCVFYV